MKAFTFLFLILCIFPFDLQAQIQEMSPMPERVTNNAVVEGYANGVPYVYSFAGLDSTKLFSGIHLRSFRYNTQTDIWDTIPPLPDDMGKIAAAASRIGDIIYIIGGYHVLSNGTEISSDKVHRYNTQTNEYLSDGSPIPVPIDDQVQAVWRDSLIFVVTGWSNNGNVTNVQIYNTVTDDWMQGTPTPNEDSYPSFGASGVIYDDTIYYFGGARNNDFNIQRHVRKGVINPENPIEISWSASIPDFSIKGYRTGAFIPGSETGIFWIGGSDNTYNYDGIAYNNGQGVEPNRRLFYYHPPSFTWQEQFYDELPMDLRGVANFDSIRYIAGGMQSGQTVSNKTFRLSDFPLLISNSNIEGSNLSIKVFPNPTEESLNITIENNNCNSMEVRVYDDQGRLVLEQIPGSCVLDLNVSKLTGGLYNLNIFSNEKSVTRKFVKLR